jgi:para-nitrobenzyl esterase
MISKSPEVTRRTALGTIGVAVGLSVMPGVAAAKEAPMVETVWGKVRGTLENGVHSFKGVRYGAPTGGANRFMPPRPPEPWAGVADATAFGAMAPQSNPNPPSGGGGGSPIILGRITRTGTDKPAAPKPVESEDCLFLNVWTGGLDRMRKRPVMVWLHGGFFRLGSGAIDGSSLASRDDVVVVSVNHRLNIFGYNHLGDIAGPEFAHSGNAGMLDIVAALEWVRDNIEAFGGDPDRVMVFGESGGGMKTSFLMASPAASGLIHRAGIQSGPGLRMMARDDASRVAEMALRELGIAPGNARQLQSVDVDKLLVAFHAVSGQLRASQFTDLPSFSPVIDPVLLPQQPFSPDAAPLASSIPMMIGWNREDMAFFKGNDLQALDLTAAELEDRARALLGDRADAALELYARLDPLASPSDNYLRMITDREIMVPTVQQALRHASAGDAGTWLYRMDWQSPAFDGKLGAPHTIETDFVFDTIGSFPEFTGAGPDAVKLAAQMSEAWVNFAAHGKPGAPDLGLPPWAQFGPDNRVAMVFDETCRVEPAMIDEKLDLFGAARSPGAG